MTTDSGLPAQVPIWQRSFLPEDVPPAPTAPAMPPAAPTLAAPPPPTPPLAALPAPTATPLSALPPPTGPAYGAPGSAVPAYPSTSYAAAPSAPAAPNRFGILPDPAYDGAAPAPYGAGSWSPVAARPSITMPMPTPHKVVTAGRWGRARGVLAMVFGGMMLLASFAGSSGTGNDAFNGVLLILLSVFLLAWGLAWLVAGQRTIEGSRTAAQALRVLAFIDLAVVAVSLASPDPTAWRGALGAVLDVSIIATMFGSEASRWLSNRR